jgi:excisionase family DNA binding protein
MAYRLLRPEQVAESLGMSPSWVYSNKHRIGFIQLGKAVRFEQSAVESYAESCKRGPQNEERKWESQSDTGKNAVVGSLRKRTTVSDINARLQAPGKVKNKQTNTPHRATLQ